MMEDDTCCFCLGGNTDIPAFGSLQDAKDLISPCSQCTVISHRKCLLEWFNALPPDKIKLGDVSSIHNSFSDMGVGQQLASSQRIDININTAHFTSWLFNIARADEETLIEDESEREDDPHDDDPYDDYASREVDVLNPGIVYLITSCPQCKHDIVFSLKRSALITLTNNIRNLITRTVQYGGVFLGFTSAITGIVSMSYVGLTTCGLKSMEALIPGPILVQFLTRKSRTPVSNFSSLSNLLLKNDNNSVDNLEQALLNGLVDPLKFSRIPILPIVLFKLRSSSLISTIFGNSKENPIPINSWFSELMINAYISSLGNHRLIRSILKNTLATLSDRSNGFNIFRGINPWKIDNMIAMLIPVRWAYDLLFRLTLNKAYFDLTLQIRPRDIANSLSALEVDRLEDLNNNLGDLHAKYESIVLNVDKMVKKDTTPVIKFFKSKSMMLKYLYKSSFFTKYFKYKIKSVFYKFVASIKHDYSQTYIFNSVVMRCITTMAWPFVSSKAGLIIYEHIIKQQFSNVPQVKLVFLSNMIGMVVVVLIKDLFNMGMSFHKGKQLSNISVLCVDKDMPIKRQRSSRRVRAGFDNFEIPGEFRVI